MKLTFHATLRPVVGERTLDIALPPGATVATLIEILVERWPGLSEHLQAEQGELSRRVNVFVAGRNARWLDGAATALDGVAEVDFFPPIAGG
ncbi:MAG: MoaD/ThiS family protein [bacterium]|nr:MoaD/ThiS family protein [bacterium]MCP5069806.1 MoaD/ThiS family protein [bacterium]